MEGFEYYSILAAFCFFALFSMSFAIVNVVEQCKSDLVYQPLKVRLSLFQFLNIFMLVFEIVVLAIENLDFLFYFSEFFKALAVLCYIEILLKLAGFEDLDGKRFSQARVESVLITQNEFSGLCLGFSLKNQEEVHWFLLKNRISSIQYCIISFSEVFIAIFLKYFVKDHLLFGVISTGSGFMWLLILKLFSFSLLFYHFYFFCSVFQQVSEIAAASLPCKSYFMGFFLFLTEFQVLALSVLTNYTEIYGTEIESVSVKLINLFYAFEIIIFLCKMPLLLKVNCKINAHKNEDVSNVVTELSSVR